MTTDRQSVSWLGLGLRRLRIDWPVSLAVAGLVLLTSFGVAATPRFLSNSADAALDDQSNSASVSQRNLTFSRLGRISAGDSDKIFAPVVEQGASYASQIPGDLAQAVTSPNYVVTSPLFELRDLPVKPAPLDRWFRFRYQAAADEYVTLERGRLPAPADPLMVPVRECEDDEPVGPVQDPESCLEELPRFETAITEDTASWLRLDIGDQVVLNPVVDNIANRDLPLAGLGYRIVMEVTGIVAIDDKLNEFWQDDLQLHQPTVLPGVPDGFQIFGMGLLHPDDYSRLLEATLPSRFSYEWRFPVDYGLIDSSNIDTIAQDVGAMSLVYDAGRSPESPAMRTGIDSIAQEFRKDWNLVLRFSSLIVVGLIGIVVSTLLVLAALAAREREETTILVRSRGGSGLRLALVRFGEALILFVPVSMIGLGLARLLVEGRSGVTPVVSTLTAALILALLFTVMALPSITGDLGRLLSSRFLVGSRLRRAVMEILLIIFAIASVVVTRRRGLDAEVAGSSFDPLVAASPLLIAMAVGVLLLRITPVFAVLASRLGGKARGVIGLIGFRSVVARRFAGQLPPIVLLIGLAITVFGVVQLDTIEKAQELGSWQTVGANYRLEPINAGSRLSPQLTLDAVDGVEALAPAALLQGQIDDDGFVRGNIQVLALDLDAYQNVAARTPAEPGFSKVMLAEMPPTDAGTLSNPVPVIISRDWPAQLPAEGSLITLVVDRRPVVVVIDEIRDVFPGVEVGRAFAVLSRHALASSASGIDASPNRLFVRAPDSAAGQLDDVVADRVRGAKLVSRSRTLSTIQSDPTMKTVEEVNQASLIVAVILAAAAVLAGFALTSRERTRDLAFLRAVGLSRRQMAWTTLTEQLPGAASAAVLGVGTGLLISRLLSSVIDISPLTGTDLKIDVVISWASLGLVTAFVLGTAVTASGIYSYANREMDLASVLRRGDRT